MAKLSKETIIAKPDEEQMLAFPINVQAILAHLKIDMKDDWFSDTLKYDDLFSQKNHLITTIQSVLSKGNGLYESGTKQTYDIPKSPLGLRYTLEIDFYDRFLYQAICSYLIEYYDPLLSNRVFSNRFNKHRTRKKYLFKHRIALWQTFEGITHLGITDGQAVLVTDLINYFEHITIESIKDSFISLLPKIKASGTEKNKIRNAIDTLVLLLEKWCFNKNHGLPQNRDASSFIANVVLTSVDKNMESLGHDYYRYVDDIRIVCKNPTHARRSLNDLIAELRKVGQNINSKKTDILTKDTDKKILAEYFPGYDDRSLAIDNMWKSKSRKVIIRSIPLLFDMLKELIEQNQTQSRQFRFCINRFKSLLSTKILDKNSQLTNEVADMVINHFEIQPASTDQFCKILCELDLLEYHFKKIEEFLTNEHTSIYHWQNHHIWLLLAYKKYGTPKLIEYALSRCKANILDSDIPACFIYLASVGDHSKVENLISEFKAAWPYQHQRYFLIALQNSSKEVLKPLVNELSVRLQGTITRIKESPQVKGVFVSDFSETSFMDIYDELSTYE